LAADESTGTIGKRFQSIKLENTEEHRRAYRQLLFENSDFSNQYIGGVIMYDETVHQKDDKGTLFVKKLIDNGIVPGIKLDLGLVNIPGSQIDQVTQGIDDLHKRVDNYFNLGCRFAKWRAAYSITETNPSCLCVELNSSLLARYASICQFGGLVPIVEPEVLVTEGSHSFQRSLDVTRKVLHETFIHLWKNNVNLERMILKPNMILSGDKFEGKKETHKEVAIATIDVLKKTVPSSVPGILFLSGGQSEDDSAIHLNEMNKIGNLPWYLSFSYGRALQHSCIQTWKGEEKNVKDVQKVYFNKALNCSLASKWKIEKCL